ncbi:hypothetical protein Salat_2159100 [Sesamum alatum]|uniref:Endonuclease/exonuclease/phosphatase domain-containing protein n=1 Tax=Sesamum alatum TaxID=300844 RepID=A0AAE1Y1J1_9LAMI|nr:hypothetical protein Salat_2159100 [Sesamum alatum]
MASWSNPKGFETSKAYEHFRPKLTRQPWKAAILKAFIPPNDYVWSHIRQWLGITRHMSTLHSAVKWLKNQKTGSFVQNKARTLALACTVYSLWRDRNEIIFEDIAPNPDYLLFSGSPEVDEPLPFLGLHCLQLLAALPAHSSSPAPAAPTADSSSFALQPAMAKQKKIKHVVAPALASAASSQPKTTQPPTAPASGKGTETADQPVTIAAQPKTVPSLAMHVHSVHAPTKPDHQIEVTGQSKEAVPNAAGLPKTTFAGLFSSNRKPSSENKLTKFTIEDGPLTLQPNDLVDVRTKLGHCLDEDRQRILAGGLYFVYECWHPNALGKIRSRLSRPIAMDSLTMSMERVSYARILLEVDASKKLVAKWSIQPSAGVAATTTVATVKTAASKKVQDSEWTVAGTDFSRLRVDYASTMGGFNRPLKHNGVSHLIKNNQLCLLGILETKLAASAIPRILSRSFPGWCHSDNFHTIVGGRILIIWNPAVIDVHPENISPQVIHFHITNKFSQLSFYISFAYGLYTIVNRRSMWEKLMDLGQPMNMPWLILGDFNCAKSTAEKQLSATPTWYELKDFVDCCLTLGLHDAPTTGCYYTWYSNSDSNPVWCKLDQMLLNNE